MTNQLLNHPAVQMTYKAGQRARQWSDQQDWQMIRSEARDLFVALVALTYTLGFYTGKAVYLLNVQLTKLSRRAAGVSEANGEVKPKAEPVASDLSGLKVADLRKLAREAGQSRAWCRVARKAELLAFLGE